MSASRFEVRPLIGKGDSWGLYDHHNRRWAGRAYTGHAARERAERRLSERGEPQGREAERARWQQESRTRAQAARTRGRTAR